MAQFTIQAGRMICENDRPLFCIIAPPDRPGLSPIGLGDMTHKVAALLNADREPAPASEIRQTVAQALAVALDAMRNCETDAARIRAGDPAAPHASFLPLRTEWAGRWRECIAHIVRVFLPSGSGFDNGIALDLDASKPEKLILSAPFHAMDSNGFYDGWREFRLTVRPSLVHGITVDISGRNDAAGLRDYVAETMQAALSAMHPHTAYYPPGWADKPAAEVTSAPDLDAGER